MDRAATFDAPAASPATPASRGNTDVLGAIVFAALVVACFGAFFITQRLKHTPTVVQRITMITAFSPTPFGRHKQERVSFRIAHADEVTVEVLDATTGVAVATLMRQQPLAAYTKKRLAWNGHTGPLEQGPLAAAGSYRLRITLRRQRRSVQSPRTFRLVLIAPQPAR